MGESGKAGVGELLSRWRNAGRVTNVPWPPPRPPPVSCFSRSRAGHTPIVGSYRFHASPPTLSGWLYFYIYLVLICCITVPRETPKPVSTWTVLLTVLAPAASTGPRTQWTPRKQMGGWRGLPRLGGGRSEPVEGPWAGLMARREDQGQRATGHLCSGVGWGPLPCKLRLHLSVKCRSDLADLPDQPLQGPSGEKEQECSLVASHQRLLPPLSSRAVSPVLQP